MNTILKRNCRSGRAPRALGWLAGILLAGAMITGATENSAEDKPQSAENLFEGGGEALNNWIELSVGGFLPDGAQSQAAQREQRSPGAFGGIEDLHWQRQLDKLSTLTLDGRAVFDQRDYRLGFELRREKLGYVRLNYQQFRTWSNGNGGLYRPDNLWYGWPGGDEALGLDCGEFSVEAGLTLENAPSAVFRYTRRFRDGEKSSTVWGQSHPGFGLFTRGLNPSFYDLDEKTDIFELDLRHRVKSTALGLGLRYETGKLDNARKMVQFPGEPTERFITHREGTTYDFFSVHGFSETWINSRLFLSSGLLFSTLNSDYSGSRIYGDDFDVSYSPNALNSLGFYDLSGGGARNEYVANLNLMARARRDLTITPSLRVQKEDWEASSTALRTSGLAAPIAAPGESDGGRLDVTERLDINYTGLTNWVLFARGEWTQGDGDLQEHGGLEQIAPINRKSEDHRNFQKYSAGFRWYFAPRMSLDAGGYYKLNAYDYEHPIDSTPNNSANRYPAFLVMQDFETFDGNARLTLRPCRTVTLVTRYEFQRSTIHTTPDPQAGLAEVEASEMTSHILAQNVNWTPCSRLYLQGSFSYVRSRTQTPASAVTQAVLDARNNYWTVNLNSGVVLDERTDLNVGYAWFRADNFRDNSLVGVPLGADAEEHGITAMLSRRLSPRLRVNLKYGYFRYRDALSGGNNDAEAHLVYSSLQYRF